MAQQISRNVYRLTPLQPAAERPARGAQYASNYSQEKYKQWQMSIEQAKLEYKSIATRNEFARKAALAARKELIRSIEDIDKQILAIRKGEISSVEGMNKYNSTQTNSNRRFNASQRASTERAQANLDMRSRQASKAAARNVAKNTITLDAETQQNADNFLIRAEGNPEAAWSGIKRAASEGLLPGNEDSLNQYGFLAVDRQLQARLDRETEARGRTLTQGEVDFTEEELLAEMPADMTSRYNAWKAEAVEKTKDGTGVEPVDSPTLTTQGVGAPGELSAESRQPLIDELEARKMALAKRARGISADEQELPNLLQRAQEVQYETFGPTGFGRKTPGFRQQQVLENAQAFVRSNIQREISKLSPDANSGEIELARTRGVQNALSLLRGTKTGGAITPRPEVAAARLEEGETFNVAEPTEEQLMELALRAGRKTASGDFEQPSREELVQLQAPETAKEKKEGDSPTIPVQVSPAQREAMFQVVTARNAKKTLEAIKATPAKHKALFETPKGIGKLGMTVKALYDSNKNLEEGGVTFRELYDRVAKHYSDDEETRSHALELLLTYNMIQEEQEVPKAQE